MDVLSCFIPQDRRQMLARGESLPDRTTGAALLADLSGFTALTEALAAAYGPRRGAEELTHLLDQIFDALIAQVGRWRGSVISFAGDAITCWFEDPGGQDSAARRAATCALALEEAIAGFASVPLPAGGTVPLALKVAITAGPARRFLVGDPAIQLFDVLAGPTLNRLGSLEERAGRDEVLLDEAAATALARAGPQGAWRADPETGARLLALTALATPVPPQPWPPLAAGALGEEQVRPWLLPAVWERLHHGAGAFLTELRPAVALFLRFSGIDYERPTAGTRLDTYIRWVQGVLVRYEANLLQLTIGDKGSYCYAVFGAPLAHADEPDRAVAAALELRTPPPNCSYIRGAQIGIASAQGWTGAYGGHDRQTYAVLGDGVNLAARLMQSAAPGGILATREVHQATETRFGWASLPALTVKGKAAPVLVWGLLAGGAERAAGLLEPVYQTPLVGRTAELAVLEEKLATARAGQGQIVAITGEAGLGKSRLVAEAARRARAAGLAIYAGSGQSYGTNTPYLAWRSVWRSFFDLDPDSLPEELALELEDKLAEIDVALVERGPLLGAVLGLAIPDTPLTGSMEPALRKSSLEALLLDCLRARSQQAPVLIVLEDIHWLDPLSHDLLEVLGRALGPMPVLLLVAYRPGEGDRRVAPPVSALAHFTEVRLAEFMPEEAAALVAERLGTQPDNSAARVILVEELTRRAQGNPFYLEELLNYLQEQGVDVHNPDALANLEWPTSLQSLLLARIDQLTEEQRTVLKVASIIGRRFLMRQLWGVVPHLGPPAQVAADLAALYQANLTPLDNLEPEPAYIFKHIITQEVTYASLPHELREHLHEQFAAWLETGSAVAGSAPPLDLLAYHYGQSRNVAKQQEYYRKAGDAAAAAYANAPARAYYEKLLELLPESAAQREVRVALGRVLTQAGEWEAAVEHYLAALAEAKAAGDDVGVGQAALGLGVVRNRQGTWVEATGWLTQAREALQRGGAGVEARRALAELGDVYGHQGQLEAARAILEESAQQAQEADDKGGVALAWSSLGTLAYEAGEYARARALLEQSLALRRELGDRPSTATVLNNIAVVAWDQGEYAAARPLVEESLALHRALGDRLGIARDLAILGNVARTQEEYTPARSLLEESLALHRELGARWGISSVLASLGLLAVAQAEYEAGRAMLEESLGIFRDLGNRWGMATVLQSLANLALDAGEHEAARPLYEESLANFRELGNRLGIAGCLVGLAAVAIIGDSSLAGNQRAARLVGAAAGLLAVTGGVLETPDQARLAQVRATVQTRLGDEAFATAWAAGHALSVEIAVAEALSTPSAGNEAIQE